MLVLIRAGESPGLFPLVENMKRNLGHLLYLFQL